MIQHGQEILYLFQNLRPWTKHHETKIWIANFWKPKGYLPVPTDGHPKKCARRNDRFGLQAEGFGCLHQGVSDLTGRTDAKMRRRFHAASSVLRVFPAAHGFDFHELMQAEQSTFAAIARLLVAAKGAAHAKAYAVGFDHA